jgi:hypothetical protein
VKGFLAVFSMDCGALPPLLFFIAVADTTAATKVPPSETRPNQSGFVRAFRFRKNKSGGQSAALHKKSKQIHHGVAQWGRLW